MAKEPQKFKRGDFVIQDNCMALVLDDSKYYSEGYILLEWIGLDWQEKFPVSELKLLKTPESL